MTNTSYETKEQTADGFRAIVVTSFDEGGGRVDFVTVDDEHHVIVLEDLAFLVRAASSLPRHLLEPRVVAQIVQATPVAEGAPQAAKAEQPARAGGRWTKEDESKLRDLYTSGSDVKAIADVLQRSPASIVSRLLALDLVEVTPKV